MCVNRGILPSAGKEEKYGLLKVKSDWFVCVAPVAQLCDQPFCSMRSPQRKSTVFAVEQNTFGCRVYTIKYILLAPAVASLAGLGKST